MAINSRGFVYPFNPEGNKPECLITGERQILNPVNGIDYNIIVPKRGPYFANTLKITYRSSEGVPYPLREGQDWYPSHHFISASRACAKPVHGSIQFIKPNLTGEVTIEYMTIGGNWVLDTVGIAALLADTLHNPRITSYEQVVNPPAKFPVIDHDWDLVDMVGMKEVESKLGQIHEALLQKGEGGLNAHINNKNNPHGTDKVLVGLGNVENMGLATPAAAAAGIDNFGYMTPKLVAMAISGQAGGSLQTHLADRNNPHGLRADQTGAYFKEEVNNLLAQKLNTTGTAYDTDRFAGYNSNQFKAWVLEGTAANAIKAYGLTLAQLKLEIQGGASADADRFGGLTPDEFKAWTLEGTAANALKLNGRTDAALKSWVLQGDAANALKLEGRDSVQLKSWVLTGTAADSTLFGGYTPEEFRASISSGTASNSLRFDGRTYLEAKQDFLTGTAANTIAFGGKNESDWLDIIRESTVANANKLSGRTLEEVKAYVLTGTAANADRLGGMTPAEWQEEIEYNSSLNAGQVTWPARYGDAPITRWFPYATHTVLFDGVGAMEKGEAVFLVSGGNSGGEMKAGLYEVRCNNMSAGVGSYTVSVRDLLGVTTSVRFGYNRTEMNLALGRATYTLYMAVNENNGPITVTEQGVSSGVTLTDTSVTVPMVAEPSGIAYVTPSGGGVVSKIEFDAYKAQVDNTLTEIANSFDAITTILTTP